MTRFWISLFLCLAMAIAHVITAHAEVYAGPNYDPARRVYSAAWYLAEFAGNDELGKPGQYITQSEMERYAHYLHYYHYTKAEMESARAELSTEAKHRDLSPVRWMDAVRVLEWFINIKEAMDEKEIETNGQLLCKFAYGSLLQKNIADDAALDAKYIPENTALNDLALSSLWDDVLADSSPKESILSKFGDDRRVYGNCWSASKYRD